jgi:hypothetical protein
MVNTEGTSWVDLWSNSPFLERQCPASLVVEGLLEKCRPPLSIGTTVCANYLDEAKLYYSLDTPPASALGGKLVPFKEILESIMAPKCVANVMDLVCNSWFRTCQEVKGDWVPSLMCRSDCEQHMEVWNACVANIGADAVLKKNFEAKMHFLTNLMGEIFNSKLFSFDFAAGDKGGWAPFTLFRCDVSGGVLGEISHEDRVSAFLLGRHPFKENVFSKKLSPFFPVGMSPEALYPDTASSYTDPDSGRLYDEVPCHHLPEYAIDELVCPDGFLPPIDPSNPRRCLLPCPVPAFTESQYTTMWAAYSAVGTRGVWLE